MSSDVRRCPQCRGTFSLPPEPAATLQCPHCEAAVRDPRYSPPAPPPVVRGPSQKAPSSPVPVSESAASTASPPSGEAALEYSLAPLLAHPPTGASASLLFAVLLFVGAALLGLAAIGSDQSHRNRFSSDYAESATANAVERIAAGRGSWWAGVALLAACIFLVSHSVATIGNRLAFELWAIRGLLAILIRRQRKG